MKKLILFALVALSLSAKGQINYSTNFYYDYTYDVYYGQWNGALQTNQVFLDRTVTAQKDTSYFHVYYNNFGVKGLGSSRIDGRHTNLLWANDSGIFKRSPIDSLFLHWNQITSKPSFFSGDYDDLTDKPTIPTNTNQLTNGAGFITQSNAYAAGFGLSLSGSAPSQTFSINTSDIMTVNRAADSIASLDAKINGKVPASRTITINGTTQDLSANRTWSNVGIELPSQAGNSGKYLTTNGTSASWATAATGTVTSVGLSSTDFTVSGSPITTSGSITANLNTTGVTAGKYDWVQVDSKGRVTSAGNMTVPTAIAAGGRNFNQAYQISSTAQSRISVSPQLSCNLSLAGGQSGKIVLEISPNGTNGWIFIEQLTGSNTGTLTVGLNTTQITGAALSADLPAGYYWRLTTTNVTGTPTYTFNGGSEITY